LFVQNCIDNSIPFLRLSDDIGYALELMQEYKTSSLAVIKNDVFVGNITEAILLEFDEDLKIHTLQENLLQHTLLEGTHLFDVLKKTAEENTYCFAVINFEKEYLGLTTPQKIIDTFIQFSSVTTTGGILVLELETRNYSLTEISKIVESNNAMILQSTMATSANQNFIQVSLKINKNDLKDIQATFERYQYTIIAVIHQSEYEVQLQERFDSLMRYLEI